MDDKFGTNLKSKTVEELDILLKYYQTGVRVTSFISSEYMQFFINSYKNYTSNKKSNTIIFDIFIISLIKGIIRGRNSVIQLINFDDHRHFYKNKINKSDITEYKSWLESIERSLKKYFKQIKEMQMSYTILDTQLQIKTIIDMLYTDTTIKIKPTNSKPHISSLIETITNLTLCRKNGKQINKCGIYNPITGQILLWDLTKWTVDKDLLYFLTERFI